MRPSFFAVANAGPRETPTPVSTATDATVIFAIAQAEQRFDEAHRDYLACRCGKYCCAHRHELTRRRDELEAIRVFSHARALELLNRQQELEELALAAEAEEEVEADWLTTEARAARDRYLRERLGDDVVDWMHATAVEAFVGMLFEELARVAARISSARGETRRPMGAE